MNKRDNFPPPIAQLSKKYIVKYLLIPLLVVSLILDILYFSLYLNSIRRRQLLLAHFGRVLISEYLGSAKRILDIAYNDYKNWEYASFIVVSKALALQPVLTNLFIVHKGNKIVQVFPNYSTDITTYPAIQFFKTAKIPPHGYMLSPPFYSIYSGTITVAIAMKPNSDDLVIGELNLKMISKANFEKYKDLSTTLFITDKRGNFIVHPVAEYVERQENIGSEAWFKDATYETTFASVAKYRGNYSIIGCVNLPETKWKIIVVTKLASVLNPIIKKSIIIFLALLGFCALLVFLSQRWISTNIILPLEETGNFVKKSVLNPEQAVEASLLAKKKAPFKELEDVRVSFLEALKHILEQQETIRESDVRFRTLTEDAPLGIIIFQNDRIVYSNKRVEVITGYTREELSDFPVGELIHPEYREIPLQLMKIRQSKILPPRHYDPLPIVTKYGDVRWIKLFISSFKVSGKPAGLAIGVDITEQHLAELEKVKYQRRFQYLQRMEAVGILAGGVAHEFNNLLQGIGLNIEMLKSKVESSSNYDDISYYVNNLEHLKSRAVLLVESLLTFSRRKKSVKQLISVHKEIECVLNLFSETFPKNIAINSSLKATKDLVFAQEGQIEQIMLNLITNARDAIGDDSGTITIETEELYIDSPDSYKLTKEGSYIRIKVGDTGIGMPQDVVNKIFDPFFTTKEVGKGTGLGLSVVLGIVENIGGSIFCESKIDEGTTFTILLPLAAELPEETFASYQSNLVPVDKLGKREFLIVDDEEIVASLIKEFLENQGHTVKVFSLPEDAISFLQKNSCDQVDLIFLDIGLPGMGGVKCLEEIKKLCPEIPVVVMSGYLNHDVMKNPEKYGATACLSKPFSTLKLVEVVNKIFQPSE